MTQQTISRGPRATLFARVLVLGLVGALVLAVPGAALAKKPGGPAAGSATVTVSPNPVAAGAAVTISGAGYRANTQLQVEVLTSTSDGYIYAASDASGSFSLRTSISAAGTAQVRVWQAARKGFTLKASTTVTVQ